ncbi:MAG: hypothetical protein AB1649_04120 [Chloroflexota bacterium]
MGAQGVKEQDRANNEPYLNPGSRFIIGGPITDPGSNQKNRDQPIKSGTLEGKMTRQEPEYPRHQRKQAEPDSKAWDQHPGCCAHYHQEKIHEGKPTIVNELAQELNLQFHHMNFRSGPEEVMLFVGRDNIPPHITYL